MVAWASMKQWKVSRMCRLDGKGLAKRFIPFLGRNIFKYVFKICTSEYVEASRSHVTKNKIKSRSTLHCLVWFLPLYISDFDHGPWRPPKLHPLNMIGHPSNLHHRRNHHQNSAHVLDNNEELILPLVDSICLENRVF